MAKKYRIKLNSGRVIGPFASNQVGELYQRGHIDGTENAQIFPIGDWTPLQNFPELKSIILKLINGEIESEQLQSDQDATVARISLAKLRKKEKQKREDEILENEAKIFEKSTKEDFQEFKFNKKTAVKINYQELEKNYQKNKKEIKKNIKLKPEVKKNQDIEKTRIINKSLLKDIEKTVVVNPPPKEKETKREKSEIIQELDSQEEKKELTEIIDANEKTHFINLKELTSKIDDDVSEIEKKLENSEESEIETIEKKSPKKIKTRKIKKKKTTIVTILALLVIYLVWDDEEKKEGIHPVWINFIGPITNDAKGHNPNLAKQLFLEGMNHYSLGTYKQKVLAADKFRKSLEANYSKNDSLGMLVRVYSELFPNSKDKRRASRVLFSLVKIARAKALKDVNVALGTSRFYFNSKKYFSAARVIENYLRVEGKPSLSLFSLYLEVLIEAGELTKAKKVFLKMADASNKPIETFLALARFYDLDEKYEDSEKIILEGLKYYPTSVSLRLKLAHYFLRKEEFKKYALLLQEIEKLKAEESPAYYAKFLEYMGILSAYRKNNKQAVIFFKLALKIHENENLRSKLASLEIGRGTAVEGLILESKAVDLIRKSKKLAREGKWEQAFFTAVQASDINRSYIPSQLNLAELQIQRGYFEDAIARLEEVRQKAPNHPGILFGLIKAFTASRKKSEAANLISQISNSKLKSHPNYPGLVGRFYYRFNELGRAIDFLNKSLSKDPLRDQDYFLKAQVFMKNRQYTDARKALVDAIDLDPLNIKYHSLNGKILYELSGAEVAIGYLRNLLKENKDNPILQGDIAVCYYKNGQIKQFEEYRQKVSKLKNRNPDFFRFLIRSASLEEKDDEIIRYSKELLRVEPGDNETRLNLGITYMKTRKYNEAVEAFKGVVERLKSYPTAHYYLAKAYLETGSATEALKMGEREVEFNPRIYHGHYITGEIYRLKGDIPKATKMLEKAVSLKPDSTEALYSLCWIKRRQNYLELALQYCRSAKNKDPSDPKIRKELGNVYAGIGQSELAVEEFETYLNLYPNAPDKSQVETNIRVLKL